MENILIGNLNKLIYTDGEINTELSSAMKNAGIHELKFPVTEGKVTEELINAIIRAGLHELIKTELLTEEIIMEMEKGEVLPQHSEEMNI